MPTDIDNVMDGFPHPIIPPISGMPTYEALQALQLALNANAASVQSNLGNGLLGLLALTVSDAVYNTLSAVAFVAPINPGATAVIPVNATADETANLRYIHTEATKRFKEVHAADKALKQQIIGAVENLYIRTLNHRITGFANVTTRQMLVHLYTTYGRLSPADIQDNDTAMKKSYSADEPIETLFHQIEDGIELADDAGATYSLAQIIAIAYNLIFATGMFPDDCREWRRRPLIEKTWDNFKAAFATAHQEYRETQTTSKQAGYHSANSAAAFELQDTVEALANLATATAADRSTVAQLSATNASLTTELAQQTAQLATARAEITALKIEVASLKRPGQATPLRPPRVYTHTNTNYCWSHGYKVSRHHTSQTCGGPKDGHQRDATRQNTMGGSLRGKDE